MIIGMSIPTFTTFHVILSMIGIVTGIIVVLGMLSATRRAAWTAGSEIRAGGRAG